MRIFCRQNAAGIGGKGSVSVKPGRDDAKGAAPAQDVAIADYQVRDWSAHAMFSIAMPCHVFLISDWFAVRNVLV